MIRQAYNRGLSHSFIFFSVFLLCEKYKNVKVAKAHFQSDRK